MFLRETLDVLIVLRFTYSKSCLRIRSLRVYSNRTPARTGHQEEKSEESLKASKKDRGNAAGGLN